MCPEPKDVTYLPPEVWQKQLPSISPVTVVTLSRFTKKTQPTVGRHWWMAGGEDIELVPYLNSGRIPRNHERKDLPKERV